MTKREMPKTFYAGLVVLESLLWGIGNPALRIGLDTLTPFWCLTLRFFPAFILFAVVFGRRAFAQLNRKNLPGVLAGSFMFAAAYILCAFSLLYTATTIAGFLMSLAVVFTPFLSFIFISPKLDWRLLPVVGVVVTGMYLLCGGGTFVFGIGELFGVLSSLTFAISLIITSKYVHHVGAAGMSFVQVGVMTACCLVCALLLEDWHVILATPPSGWVAIAYMALGCTFVAYLLQNVALKHVSPVVVALAFSAEPVFTALASYVMLGETLSTMGYIGAALVTAGIVLASLLQRGEGPIVEGGSGEAPGT